MIKVKKYDDAYAVLRFTVTTVEDMERPLCLLSLQKVGSRQHEAKQMKLSQKKN